MSTSRSTLPTTKRATSRTTQSSQSRSTKPKPNRRPGIQLRAGFERADGRTETHYNEPIAEYLIMQLTRRNTIIGLGTVAAGAGIISGSGAFDSVEANRSFEV